MSNNTLEQDMKRLEVIVGRLGSDELSLQEMLDLYSEGVKLSKNCMEQLENARQVVEQGRMELEQNDGMA